MSELFGKIILAFVSVIVPVALALIVKHRARGEKQGTLNRSTGTIVAIWLVMVILGASYITYLAIDLVDNWEDLTMVQRWMCGFAVVNLVVQAIAATSMVRQINAPLQLPR